LGIEMYAHAIGQADSKCLKIVEES
jgi:hypothetical protein